MKLLSVKEILTVMTLFALSSQSQAEEKQFVQNKTDDVHMTLSFVGGEDNIQGINRGAEFSADSKTKHTYGEMHVARFEDGRSQNPVTMAVDLHLSPNNLLETGFKLEYCPGKFTAQLNEVQMTALEGLLMNWQVSAQSEKTRAALRIGRYFYDAFPWWGGKDFHGGSIDANGDTGKLTTVEFSFDHEFSPNIKIKSAAEAGYISNMRSKKAREAQVNPTEGSDGYRHALKCSLLFHTVGNMSLEVGTAYTHASYRSMNADGSNERHEVGGNSVNFGVVADFSAATAKSAK